MEGHLDLAKVFEQTLTEEETSLLLSRVYADVTLQSPFAQQLLQQFRFWLQEANDLDSVSRICKALLDNLQALDAITSHFDPAEMVVMLAVMLDQPDIGQVSDEPSTLCNILLFTQLLCHRYAVPAAKAVPEGRQDSFLGRYMQASSVTYRLADLVGEEKQLVARWISALFDNEGISDELIRDSSPRTLLRLAPTLFSQSIKACNAGMIDLDTLRGGLSYFLQDLLSYTLPGAVRWLLQDIVRLPPDDGRTVHIQVLRLILDSETCPPVVRQLIAKDFANLAATTTAIVDAELVVKMGGGVSYLFQPL